LIDWGTISTAAIAAVTVGSAVIAVATRMIRHTLRSSFATIPQLQAAVDRLEIIERRIERMPDASSMAAFGARLGGVEQSVAVAGATIIGVKEGLSRVEHMMGLLLESELRKEAGAKS
jgi:hypothetical protein